MDASSADPARELRLLIGVACSGDHEYKFLHDIDLRTPLPRRGLIGSALAHAALLVTLYVAYAWQGASLANPFFRQQNHGYALSAYLPELHGAPTHAHARGKPDPVLAKQKILSLRRNPDSLRQTVVIPPKIKLKQDVDLPNFIAYAPEPVPVLAKPQIPALPRNPDSLRHAVVTPPQIKLKQKLDLPNFTSRGPESVPVLAKRKILTLPRNPEGLSRTVVTPPNIKLKPGGDLPNLAARATEAVPVLAKPEILSLPRNPESLRHTAVAPPKMGLEQNVTQIVALNLHPSERPVEVPSGNRSGAFAASPTGSPEATGTPGNLAIESKARFNAPAGISVSAVAPSGAPNVASQSLPAPDASNRAASAGPDVRAKLKAAMHLPAAPYIPARQSVARESADQLTEVENRIFAGRRSYTLSVNLPNLNGAIGSWIVHFAERGPETDSERDPEGAGVHLAAPEVLSKSDPAYPGDLIEGGVHGTVVLIATIHADGSVGEIAIVKSLNARLDRNAAEAFSHWVFRPALKDGQTIDVQAVVAVPFRTASAKY